MTYVSKKEKVFDLPEHSETSIVSLKKPEIKLKRFPSVSDQWAWASEECQRYQHFYRLVSGSESSIAKASGFKYIPFDVLLAILMAEKDAYIQELLERQENRSCCGGKANVLYKAEGFEDSDDDREALIRKDAEVVALKNKIAGLESELEDYRDTLTKAMQKLEKMDAILSENSLLKEKIKCSEETVLCLEAKKAALEKQLKSCEIISNIIERDLDKKSCYSENQTRWDNGDCETTAPSFEKNILLLQIEELQKELEKAKIATSEMDEIRKISGNDINSLGELRRENECFKKKLKSMKTLEKHIEELKKQAHTLADKYKKECQKSNDQMKQIHINVKERQRLMLEKYKLEQKVNELATYESQYLSLEAKLHQVELIIDENEILNKKLIQLDKLEQENEQLKTKLNELKFAEIQVVEDKEKIMQLQCALLDQEEEMKKMLRQIEDLSREYLDKNEIYCMQNELEEKNNKLKIYEKQLAEIPVLESEIDQLKNKLQKCLDDFKKDKDTLKRLQDELEICQKRCRELEEMVPSRASQCNCENEESTNLCFDNKKLNEKFKIQTVDKGENPIEISWKNSSTQSVVKENKEQSIEAFLIDIGFEKLKELEEQNKNLKNEVEILRLKLSQIDLDDLINQTKELQSVLHLKERKIFQLESEIGKLRKEANNQELKENLLHLKDEIKVLNIQLEKESNLKIEVTDQINELKVNLHKEKKAREFSVTLAKELEKKLEVEVVRRQMIESVSKLQKEEANASKQQFFFQLVENSNKFKSCCYLLKMLIKELKVENQVLRENLKQKARKDLIQKLQAEVKVLKSLSKPELQKECVSLREKVKQILKDMEILVEEILLLKSALDSEKSARNYLEKEITNLQLELSACITAGNQVLGREITSKENVIVNLQNDLVAAKENQDNFRKKIQFLEEQNLELSNNLTALKAQQNNSERDLDHFQSQVEKLTLTIKAYEEKQAKYLEETNNYRLLSEAHKNESSKSKELIENLQKEINEMNDLLKVKETEIDAVLKLSEKGISKTKLQDKILPLMSDTNDKKELEDKHAVEEELGKLGCQLEWLKTKLKECVQMEEEIIDIKNKKNFLLKKMTNFEAEIDFFSKKLQNFALEKNKLEEKDIAERRKACEDLSDYKEEVDFLKMENENLKGELLKTENLLEVYKKLQKTLPQGNDPTSEFFTPPAVPSPQASDIQEFEEEVITLEKHKKDINDLENRYKQEIENLKAINAEKIKKLVNHHQEEINRQSKSFHESISGMKSSYENDIRKLAEKHKSSIMRLQGLHEDEVQELNTNYETQMEAMQTQNENLINDLRTESAEKCKQLREHHRRQMDALESKYSELLRKRESLFLEDKAQATQNTNDIQEMQKTTVDDLTQFYQNSIMELEEKHNEELKKCKKISLKKIEIMKNKYEALLVEERKKYKEHLEELLQLKNEIKGQQGDCIETEKNLVDQNKIPVSSTRLEFVEVLGKIINEGIESLSFEELILVHSKTCFLPESSKVQSKEEFPGSVGDRCRHKACMTAEKEELLKRIFTLENEIIIKQLETHEAIANMETAEKYRIQELQNALEVAQQKNLELKRLLSNQSKLHLGLKIDRYMLDRQASFNESNVIEKVKEVEREKAEKKRLEEELEKERANVKHLTTTLEAEKERFKSQRKRDSDYVDSIRLRLEEAMKHEQMMESQLEYEMRIRGKLESELNALQKSFNLISEASPIKLPVEPKALKDTKNLCDATKEQHIRNKNRHRSKSKTAYANKKNNC